MVSRWKRFVLAGLSGTAVATLLLAGCSSAGEDSSGGDAAYDVTFIGPLSGTNADLGVRPVDAIQVLFDKINADGGVERPDGTRVTFNLHREDDLGTPQGQTLAIRKAARGSGALIGGMTSSPTIAGMDVAQAEGIPYVIVGAVSNSIEEKIVDEDMNLIFHAVPNATERSGADMEALQDLQDGRDLYIVSQDTDWGRDTTESAVAAWEEQGGTVTVEYIPGGTTEFSSQLLKIKNAAPDVVYAALTGQEVFSFTDQKYSSGDDTLTFVAGSSAASDVFIETAGVDVTNGVITNSVWAPILSGEVGEEFAAAYEKLGKRGAPADLEAQAYDGAMGLVEAVKIAKTLDPSDVAAALLEVEFEGLRGLNAYDETTHGTPGLTFLMTQIQDGKFVAVWPSEWSGAELQ